MRKNYFQPMRVFGLTLLIFSIFLTGCNSWFAADKPDQEEISEPTSPPQPVVVDGVRTSFADVVEKTSPAVVMIERTSAAQIPGRTPRERGFGSGVIVSSDGTILTNHHVIEGAEKITVRLNNNKTYDAKVVGSDKLSDLAVLKIEETDLPFLEMGDSDQVRIGDIVLAIGNPLGIGQTVTSGIISAKGRRTGINDGSFQDFLQTDAPINQGNSGGALINVKGELIGINSQILSRSGGNIGIGFAIPSNMANSVMEQLISNGRVRRGKLGIGIQPLTEEFAEQFNAKGKKGVLITQVMDASAADKAGLKRYDIIISINGEPIEDPNSLRNQVAGTKPGTEIKLNVLRDGEEKEFTATLDEFEPDAEISEKGAGEKDDSEESQTDKKLGISLQPMTPEFAERLEVPGGTKGLVVTNVAPNGAAAEEGITKGDVIIEINREKVETLQEFQTALEKTQGKLVLLLVARKDRTFLIPVTPK